MEKLIKNEMKVCGVRLIAFDFHFTQFAESSVCAKLCLVVRMRCTVAFTLESFFRFSHALFSYELCEEHRFAAHDVQSNAPHTHKRLSYCGIL